MIQIIPNILTNSITEVEQKLTRLQGVCKHVHIDVLDGKYAKNSTVSLVQLKKIKQLSYFYPWLHLMVVRPLDYIKPASDIKTKVIIGHVEKMLNQKSFIKAVKNKKMKVGLALDFGSSYKIIKKDLLKKLDFVLVMTIKAGWSGQEFKSERLKEVRELKRLKEKYNYKYKIAVDGGVNENTIKDCVTAGAQVLFMHSAIWKHKNIRKAIYNLQFVAKES